MSKFKRFLSLLMAVVLTVTMMSGCGQEIIESNSDGVVSGDQAVTEVPEETTEVTTTIEVTTTTAATTTVATTTTEATTTATTSTTASTTYTVEEMSATMYATYSVNVRSGPSVDYDRIGAYAQGAEVTVTGRASTDWYQVNYKGETGYVSSSYLSSEPVATTATTTTATTSSSGSTTVITGTVSAGDWAEENGWETMVSYLKEDRYLTVMNEVMEGIQNLQTTIYVSPYITADEASDFANLILPMLSVGYCYVKSVGASVYSSGTYEGYLRTVTVTYYVSTAAEAQSMVDELDTKADKIVAKLSSSWSDYQKVKYLTEYLVLNCTYDGDVSTAPTAYGSVVKGAANCQGYAKGLLYLLAKAGFDVVFCEGIGTEAKHLWVKVKINGSWYNVDPTWCDPVSGVADPDYFDYSFLCVTDEFMAATHKTVYNMRFYTVPSATSTTYDWYIMNGYYATSYDEAVSILKQATKDAVNSADGAEYIYVRAKVSSDSIYESVKSNYSKSSFQNNIVSSITSSYTVDEQLSRSSGCYRVYRLKKS